MKHVKQGEYYTIGPEVDENGTMLLGRTGADTLFMEDKRIMKTLFMDKDDLSWRVWALLESFLIWNELARTGSDYKGDVPSSRKFLNLCPACHHSRGVFKQEKHGGPNVNTLTVDGRFNSAHLLGDQCNYCVLLKLWLGEFGYSSGIDAACERTESLYHRWKNKITVEERKPLASEIAQFCAEEIYRIVGVKVQFKGRVRLRKMST